MKQINLLFLIALLNSAAFVVILQGAWQTASAQGVRGTGPTREVTVRFKESAADFPNPERGFYIPLGTSARHFIPLEADKLRQLFAGPQKHGKARYAVYSTLLMREYTLDSFLSQPLNTDFLSAVDMDLSVVRSAGLKVILRFAYTNTAKSGDCPDVNKICPPYGDAAKAVVLEHIGQLKPLFQKYADIIAVLQEGFIGIWGENYYTDYFGDASGNGPGRIPDKSWEDRREVLHALLEALSKDRMVQVRTPQIKQKYVYGPGAGVGVQPLSLKEAFTGSDSSRIGFHNDCFLSGADDYGTYYDYGSSATPKKEANKPLREYVHQDSRYVAVGGETCDDVYSPENDCSPLGHAEEEMRTMHVSFLNTAYNNDVNNDWDSLGCIGSIRKRLGYRLLLQEVHFPTEAVAGHSFSFSMQIRNDGYASPFNARPLQLILRNQDNGKELTLPCQADLRTWFSGNITWKETLKLPGDMPPGKYELLLALPDPYPSLTKRPAYCIRLANEDCWEMNTGYNKLNFVLTVKR
ncbi:DUF4832 domain-containing protein [Flavitalea flava]